jgi:hypothetical protein
MTKKFLIMHQLASIRKPCVLQDKHDKLRHNDNNLISVLSYYNESAWWRRRWRWRKRRPKTQFQIYFPPTPGKRTGTYSACVLGVRLLYWHHGEHVLWGWKRGKKSVSLSVNWEGGFDPCSFNLWQPYHSKVFFFLWFSSFFFKGFFSTLKYFILQKRLGEGERIPTWPGLRVNPQYCKQPY